MYIYILYYINIYIFTYVNVRVRIYQEDRYDYCLLLRSNSQIHDVKISIKPILEQN